MLRSPPHHPMVELPPMQAVGAVSSPGPEHTVATALPCPRHRHRHRHRHRFGRQLSLSADSGMAYQMTAEQSRAGQGGITAIDRIDHCHHIGNGIFTPLRPRYLRTSRPGHPGPSSWGNLPAKVKKRVHYITHREQLHSNALQPCFVPSLMHWIVHSLLRRRLLPCYGRSQYERKSAFRPHARPRLPRPGNSGRGSAHTYIHTYTISCHRRMPNMIPKLIASGCMHVSAPH